MVLARVAEIDAVETGNGESEDELEETHDSVDYPEGPAALAVFGAAFEVEAHPQSCDDGCCGWFCGARLVLKEQGDRLAENL